MAHIALIGAETEENLALRYIQASLEQDGHRVSIIPFNSRRDIHRVSGLLASCGADIAGLSMVFTSRSGEFADLARGARETGYTGHITAGGHFAAFNAGSLLSDNHAIDSIAIGEGEHIMRSLARNLHDLSMVDGLVYRGREGEVIQNGPCVPPADLDSLPFPTHKNPPDTYHGLAVANILSSRGCGSSCSFCSISAWHKLCGGERLRLRTPEKIAEEMSLLWNSGYRIFNFHDDNFVLKNSGSMIKRMVAFKDALEQKGVGRIAFAVKCRPDSVDREVFQFMKDMGLFRVFVGIEAGTDASLRQLGRGHSVNDNRKALKILNSLDLQVCFNLILLNPESTLDDLVRNVSFLRAFPGNPMNFCRAEVYAGTPLEQKLRTEGRLLGDYTAYDYTIADSAAQSAFELINRILYERHHTAGNMHHASMILDYEQRLKSYFFRHDASLSDGVKDFIIRLNNDSCSRLESIINYAGGHLSSKGRETFVERSRLAVRRTDNKYRKEYESLLRGIRGIKSSALPGSSYIKKIAALIGMAAAVTAAAPACQPETHMCETVPDYYYNGWVDDSTYTCWGESAPDMKQSNKAYRRENTRRNAVADAKIRILKNFFAVELKDESDLKNFNPDSAAGREVFQAVMNCEITRATFSTDDYCEVVVRVTLPGLRSKVTEIQSRSGK